MCVGGLVSLAIYITYLDRSANGGRLVFNRLVALLDTVDDSDTPRRGKTSRTAAMASLEAADGDSAEVADATPTDADGYIHPLKHLVDTAMTIQTFGPDRMTMSTGPDAMRRTLLPVQPTPQCGIPEAPLMRQHFWKQRSETVSLFKAAVSVARAC
jgi:hypothetical protein